MLASSRTSLLTPLASSSRSASHFKLETAPKTKPVASPAGSAAQSAEDQTATARHSRVQLGPLVHLLGIRQNRAKRCPPEMKQQVTLPSFQISASREAAGALGAGFVSQFLEPAAVRNNAASFSLVRGGGQIRGRPAWSARSGLPLFFFTKVSGLSGTLQVFPLLTLCCLTPRSRRGPTAGHQARSGGTRYIFASPPSSTPKALVAQIFGGVLNEINHLDVRTEISVVAIVCCMSAGNHPAIRYTRSHLPQAHQVRRPHLLAVGGVLPQ